MKSESVKSNFRAVVSRSLASALINVISNAAEEGRPLTELQQIDMATMSHMEYADAVYNFESTLEVEASMKK